MGGDGWLICVIGMIHKTPLFVAAGVDGAHTEKAPIYNDNINSSGAVFDKRARKKNKVLEMITGVTRGKS